MTGRHEGAPHSRRQNSAPGEYVPVLLEVTPRLVRPADADDYFSHEQVTTWDINDFWVLPEYPHTPYYRSFQTVVHADAHLYEFVVPMIPPSWNDQARVAAYAADHRGRVASLDICAPAVDQGRDYGHPATLRKEA